MLRVTNDSNLGADRHGDHAEWRLDREQRQHAGDKRLHAATSSSRVTAASTSQCIRSPGAATSAVPASSSRAAAAYLTTDGDQHLRRRHIGAVGILQVASDDKLGAAGKGITLCRRRAFGRSATSPPSRPHHRAAEWRHFQTNAGETLALTGSLDGPGGSTTVGTGTLVLGGTRAMPATSMPMAVRSGATPRTVRGNIIFDTNANNPNARSVTFDQADRWDLCRQYHRHRRPGQNRCRDAVPEWRQHLQHRHHRFRRHLAGHQAGACRAPSPNDAAVIFDQSFDGTYAGNMTGTGTLTKNGSGSSLSPVPAVSAVALSINAGGLAVNGTLISDITSNGGVLRGVGKIKGDVTEKAARSSPAIRSAPSRSTAISRSMRRPRSSRSTPAAPATASTSSAPATRRT